MSAVPSSAPMPPWFAPGRLALVALVRRAELVAGPNLLCSRQVDERLLRPAAPGEHLRRVRQRQPRRYEVILEGTATRRSAPRRNGASTSCRASRATSVARPRQFAPYHLRLDWLMWFLPLSAHYPRGWFHPLLTKLLEGDAAILRLFADNPFPHHPPSMSGRCCTSIASPAGLSAAAAAPGGRAYSPRSSSNRCACRTAADSALAPLRRFVNDVSVAAALVAAWPCGARPGGAGWAPAAAQPGNAARRHAATRAAAHENWSPRR